MADVVRLIPRATTEEGSEIQRRDPKKIGPLLTTLSTIMRRIQRRDKVIRKEENWGGNSIREMGWKRKEEGGVKVCPSIEKTFNLKCN